MSGLLSNRLSVPLSLGGGDEGRKKVSNFNCTFFQFACSPPGWPLWELRWVLGVSAQGETISMLQGFPWGCVGTVPPIRLLDRGGGGLSKRRQLPSTAVGYPPAAVDYPLLPPATLQLSSVTLQLPSGTLQSLSWV